MTLFLRTENVSLYVLFPVDVAGRRELFTCNEDGVDADNYFCELEDDDGESFAIGYGNVIPLVMLMQSHYSCCICEDNVYC